MRLAKDAHGGSLSAPGAHQTATHCVKYNGVGFFITCPRETAVPLSKVVICESKDRISYFVACKS